jgi:hypothetical protein
MTTTMVGSMGEPIGSGVIIARRSMTGGRKHGAGSVKVTGSGDGMMISRRQQLKESQPVLFSHEQKRPGSDGCRGCFVFGVAE